MWERLATKKGPVSVKDSTGPGKSGSAGSLFLGSHPEMELGVEAGF